MIGDIQRYIWYNLEHSVSNVCTWYRLKMIGQDIGHVYLSIIIGHRKVTFQLSSFILRPIASLHFMLFLLSTGTYHSTLEFVLWSKHWTDSEDLKHILLECQSWQSLIDWISLLSIYFGKLQYFDYSRQVSPQIKLHFHKKIFNTYPPVLCHVSGSFLRIIYFI